MKTYKIITILIAIITISCKAQNPIVGLDAPSSTPRGAYYKDLNNELDKFVGTWKYVDGNTSLTIVLEKNEKVFSYKDYYDELAGEFKYIENGVEIVNTLPNLSSNNEENIAGSYIKKPNQRPRCDDCTTNERRIQMYFNDPERSYLSVVVVVRDLVGQTNPNKITATIFSRHGGILPTENLPTIPRVPYGEYLMEKQ